MRCLVAAGFSLRLPFFLEQGIKKGSIIKKSPLSPLYQRGALFLPLAKEGYQEGFYNYRIFHPNLKMQG